MMRRALLALIALSLAAAAQQPVSPKTDYRITFSALTEKGDPAEIEPSDVTIEVGGRPAVLRDLKHFRNVPIRVMVVLDRSGSMRDRWDASIGVLTRLVTGLPKDSTVGLIGFGDEPGEVFKEPGQFVAMLATLKPTERVKGRTALWDTVHKAAESMTPRELGDAVVLITDAGDNRSKLSVGDLRKQLRGRNLRIFSALLTDDFAATDEERQGPNDLFRIMSETGGWNLTSNPFLRNQYEVRKLDDVMPKFTLALSDFYVADIVLEQPITKPTRLKFKLEKRLGQKRKPSISAPATLLPGP
jgi:hypothetical protein